MSTTLSANEWEAIFLSLKVGLWCVLISLPGAIFFGWLLARRNFFGKLLVEVVVHLPLVLPPVVTGYLLLRVMGRNGFIGSLLAHLGIQLSFSWRGAALASAVVGFPLMVRAIRLSIEAVDPKLEEASLTLGHSPLRTFRRITLPLCLPGIAAGSLLSFARSLGEFGATIVFVGNISGETRTLPLAIFTAVQIPNGEAIASRLVIAAVLLATVALAGSELYSRRLKRFRVLG